MDKIIGAMLQNEKKRLMAELNEDGKEIEAFVQDWFDGLSRVRDQDAIEDYLSVIVTLFLKPQEALKKIGLDPKTWDVTKSMRLFADDTARKLHFVRYAKLRNLTLE